MFLRLLFLLLLVLNVGVGGWLLFGGQRPAPVAPTDRGVAELQLLSNRAPAVQADESRAPAPKADGRCLSVGPYDTQAQTRDAIAALGPHVPRIQFHEEQSSLTRGWWVYLPAMRTHEQALSAARALSAKGVHDYYVVTAGDQQNTVSLGLFNDQANAQRRLDQVQALGFDARMSQRVDTLPVYRVDFAVPAAPGFNWQQYLTAPDLDAHPVACF